MLVRLSCFASFTCDRWLRTASDYRPGHRNASTACRCPTAAPPPVATATPTFSLTAAPTPTHPQIPTAAQPVQPYRLRKPKIKTQPQRVKRIISPAHVGIFWAHRKLVALIKAWLETVQVE